MTNIAIIRKKTGDSGNTYWECVERSSSNGSGVRITLDQCKDFFELGQDTHSPNPELIAVKKIRIMLI